MNIPSSLLASLSDLAQLPVVDTLLTWAPAAVAVLLVVGVVGACVLVAFALILASVRRARAAEA